MLVLNATWFVVAPVVILILLAVIIAGAGKIYRQVGRGKGRKK